MHDIPCTYRISLKALIKDADDRILLIRKDGYWELPGGGLEHNENVLESLTREIAEETGMVVTSVGVQPIDFWTIRKEVGKPDLHWFAYLLYEVTVAQAPHPHQSDEADEVGYFHYDETLTLPLHDNSKPYFIKH